METGANRIVKVTDGQLTIVAGSGEDGFANGHAAQAAFSASQGVAVGEDGTSYVSDTVNSAVRQIRDGVVSTLAHRDVDAPEAFIPISSVGLALSGDQLYICDSSSRKVFVLSLTQ